MCGQGTQQPFSHSWAFRYTVRENGRIIDDTRMVLGSSEILVAKFKLGKIFSFPAIKDWSLHICRVGVVTSTWGWDYSPGLWPDIAALVSLREAEGFDTEPALDQLITWGSLETRPREGNKQPFDGQSPWIEWPWKAGSPAIGLPATAVSLNEKQSLRR